MNWLLETLAPALALDSTAKLVKIDGEQTHHVFKLTQRSRCFAVKVFDGNNLSQQSREQQFVTQKKIAKCGLAPEPIWLSENHEIWVEEWVTQENPLQSEIHPTQLAKALASIHSCQIQTKILDLDAAWQHYIRLAGLPNGHEWIEQAIDFAVSKEHLVFCHHDLAYAHLLSVEPIKVVDWEYAAIGNRYYDLASCCIINALDETNKVELVTSYANLCDLDTGQVLAEMNALIPSVQLTQKLWHAAKHMQSM